MMLYIALDVYTAIPNESYNHHKFLSMFIDGAKMGVTNRIETMLMDNFNLIINENVYLVSPPPHIEKPKVQYIIKYNYLRRN
jgi:hypothetical protein